MNFFKVLFLFLNLFIYSINKAETNSLADFKSKLSSTTGKDEHDMVAAVIAAEDLEKTLACYDSEKSFMYFSMFMRKAPASAFKNEVVLRLLQKPWPADFQPDDDQPRDNSGPDYLQLTLCLQTMQPYFTTDASFPYEPGEGARKWLSRKWRVKLAAKFRAALEAKGEPPQSGTENPAAPAVPLPTLPPPMPPPPALLKKSPPQPVPAPSPGFWSWLWLPGILAAVSFAVWLLKRRKLRTP